MPRGPLRGQVGPKLGPAEPPLHGPSKPMTASRQEVRPGPTEQLPMFMRGSDIVSSLTGTVDFPSRSVDEVMALKVDQAKQPMGSAHGAGVYDAVSQHGVLSPVQMIHGVRDERVMGQGHHRAASAADIEYETGKDKWVPVVHTEGREHSQRPFDLSQSNAMEKLSVMLDHRDFAATTSAIGQDIGWRQQSEDAAKKPPKPLPPPGPNASPLMGNEPLSGSDPDRRTEG